MNLSPSKIKNIFVTGTDTHVGKTVFAGSLLIYLNNLGNKTLAFKPISAGCIETAEGLRNQDAMHLSALASTKIPYEEINPFAFKLPIAPHIAAAQLQHTIKLDDLLAHYNKLQNYAADNIVIEGAGGWRVPLNATEFISDWIKAAQIPVILVAGIRLGCINHTLLTWQALKNDGIHLLAWAANILDSNMLVAEENIGYLQNTLDAPLLGVVPYDKNINSSKMGHYLNFNLVFKRG